MRSQFDEETSPHKYLELKDQSSNLWTLLLTGETETQFNQGDPYFSMKMGESYC